MIVRAAGPLKLLTVHYEIEINGRLRQVTVRRVDGQFVVTLDGRAWKVDAARVDGHTWSLLIGGEVLSKPSSSDTPDLKVGPACGGSSEVRLKPDTTYVGPSFSSGETPTASYEVTLTPDGASGGLMARVGDTSLPVAVNSRRRWGRKDESPQAGSGGSERLVAPMPGKIVRVLVKTGEAVRARQPMVVIEAMKMENELRAQRDGVLTEIPVSVGASVKVGDHLFTVDIAEQ
jgi:biotin carboxyl carrier protein